MDLFEADTHSFVIKIWLEETAVDVGQVVWRGQITHVPSKQQSYFMKLEDIPLFILPHMKTMGVQPEWRWRMQFWLK